MKSPRFISQQLLDVHQYPHVNFLREIEYMVWRGLVWWYDGRKCTKFSSLQYLVKNGMVLCFRDSVLCVWIE